jgi:adenylosuccinate lyase
MKILLQHPDKTFATYLKHLKHRFATYEFVIARCTTSQSTFAIDIKHLQHTSKTPEIFKTYV